MTCCLFAMGGAGAVKIYDISRTLQEAPLYPGDAPVEVRRVKDVDLGDAYTESILSFSSHAGTHVDAPRHFLSEGATVDQMPLAQMCGSCRVLNVPRGLIRQEDLMGRLAGAQRIALRTKGKAWLCEQSASYLAVCGVKLVVTDAPSIAPEDNEAEVHRILMRAGVGIVENAEFSGVADGDYLIFAFPVKIGGCDGAPVRAVLLEN